MSDKFRTTQPLKISFVKGEQPSSGKLNALAEQPRQGSNLLEKAIGDLWNSSGDAVLAFAPLQLNNLARTVGGAKYLNPAIYPLGNEFRFTEHWGENNPGLTQGYLKFPVKSGSTVSPVAITPGMTVVNSNTGSTTNDEDTDATVDLGTAPSETNTLLLAVAMYGDGTYVESTPSMTGVTFTKVASHNVLNGSTRVQIELFRSSAITSPGTTVTVTTSLAKEATDGRAITLWMAEVSGLWTLLDPFEVSVTNDATNTSPFVIGATPASLQTNSSSVSVVAMLPKGTTSGSMSVSLPLTELASSNTTASDVNFYMSVFDDDVTTLGGTHNTSVTWSAGANASDQWVGFDVLFRQVEDRFLNEVNTESLVNASGDYWIDYTTGRFRTFDPLFREDQLTYDVDMPNDYLRGQESLPSIIPDPDQDTFTSCRVSTSGGKFYLHLPPRRPVRDGTNVLHHNLPRSYPSSNEEASNEQTVAGQNAPYKMWSGSTTALDGAGDEVYRYKLPKEIQDRWSSMSVGQELPAGFLYLWDKSSGTVIEDVVFKKTADITNKDETVLEVSSDTVDFSLRLGADESASSYNVSQLVLITTGSSLAQSIHRLTEVASLHEHSSGSYLDQPVVHSSLLNQDPEPYASPSQSTNYPSYLPEWPASKWTGDNHTSLLSRAGSATVAANQRDKYNNAMLGHLLMANADLSGADNYLDATLPDNSFRIYFGDMTGPSLYSGVITGQNHIITDTPFRGDSATAFPGIKGVNTSTGAGVSGNSTSGRAVEAISSSGGIAVYASTNSTGTGVRASTTGSGAGLSAHNTGTGYAAEFHGDTTTPNKSAIFIEPQDADPITTAKGDVYINSTSGRASIHNGTEWGRLSGKVYTLTATENSNTTGNFTASYTIPANTLRVGSTIKITVGGHVQNDASGGNVSLQILGEGLTLVSTGTRTASTLDNFYLKAIGTVRAVGASGSIQWGGHTSFATANSDGLNTAANLTRSPDLTTGYDINVLLTLGFSGASDTVDLDTFIVEISD